MFDYFKLKIDDKIPFLTTYVVTTNAAQFASKESIETLSALEIAEQMTYLDHQIFLAIRSE